MNLVNIYAPCSVSAGRVLWSNLLARRVKYADEEWCLGGDFNEILSRGERLGEGTRSYKRGMEDFREFLARMEVIDIPCVGGKFTWYKDNGKAMSRIDRFLVSNNLIEVWGVIDQRIGVRDFSDHTPIRLNCGVIDWGPKPFRFNNSWLKHKDFKEFVCSEWGKLKMVGRGDFVLFEKLKLLKISLRRWNCEVFGWMDLKVKDGVERINDLDNLMVANFGNNNEVLVKDRRETSNEVWQNLLMKESMLRLKSRQLWLKDGDRNSRFFHNSIKDRNRKNSISVLEGVNGRVEGVDDVKREVKNHFENYFKEESHNRAVSDGLNLFRLSDADKYGLELPFSEEEIKLAVWDCDGSKSPGPDGFTLEFFQFFWELVKGDVVNFFKDFYEKAKLTKGVSSSFIALIPKVKNPRSLSEYRPICLVGCLYKILAKVLAGRLRGLIRKLVSLNQTAFIPGRNISDGVLVVNEVLDLAKRKKRSCVVLKVDFEKAYDRVSWDFLRFVLIKMGFGDLWMRWMEGCTFSSSMSVLINGSTTKDFKVGKGLRQGDPLSPFLFVLVTESLRL